MSASHVKIIRGISRDCLELKKPRIFFPDTRKSAENFSISTGNRYFIKVSEKVLYGMWKYPRVKKCRNFHFWGLFHHKITLSPCFVEFYVKTWFSIFLGEIWSQFWFWKCDNVWIKSKNNFGCPKPFLRCPIEAFFDFASHFHEKIIFLNFRFFNFSAISLFFQSYRLVFWYNIHFYHKNYIFVF